jgi:hypothetical protein
MALFASDGSWNVTSPPSITVPTGLYSPQGTINIVASSGLPEGIYHRCGAMIIRFTVTDQTSSRSPEGALWVSQIPYKNGTQRVTVV